MSRFTTARLASVPRHTGGDPRRYGRHQCRTETLMLIDLQATVKTHALIAVFWNVPKSHAEINVNT